MNKRTPQFITDDGVSLYNDSDEYYRVYDDLSYGKFKVSDGTAYPVLKSLSTESAAQEFVTERSLGKAAENIQGVASMIAGITESYKPAQP